MRVVHHECGRQWSEHACPAATPEPPAQPAPVARIPLTIIVTATGEQTKGVLVAVMAEDLDALEAKIASQEELGTSLCAALAEGEAINASLAAALEAAERRIADSERRLFALAAEQRRLLRLEEAVEEVLDDADSGEFATAGRDFGRGVAEMARRVRAALSGTGEGGGGGKIKDATEEEPGTPPD